MYLLWRNTVEIHIYNIDIVRNSKPTPPHVYAEANWYGSLRIGVQSSDSNLSVVDGASRWGIRGSHEAGEGLTAVYRFETKIDGPTAGSPGGRLSYVGLSGAFGTLTVGQVWSATYNAAGAMLDRSWYYGNAGTSLRVGSAVSYAFSNDLMALQVDAVYDDERKKEDNPREDLESIEFGLTVNVGEIGKVAFAHTDNKYMEDHGANNRIGDGDLAFRVKTATVAGEVSVSGLTAYVGTQSVSYDCITAYDDGTGLFTFPCAGITSIPTTKATEKTTFLGVSGGLGDTGVGYVLQWNDQKSNNTNPWVLSLAKGLGDSASLVFEHADNDGGSANETQLGLVVNF